MTSPRWKPARDVSTASVTALGLIGGWVSARESGVRPLGTVLLGAAAVWAGRTWYARHGAGPAAALLALYVAAFGASHPLARRIGPWPAVLTATTVTAGTAYLASDRRA
ncbi:hypothetical protein [Propionicicella superfundia]|uniref:hypothetical protein n=1 Tax=Propionicicella superfundia TaxID=348582 RepID=UPI00048AAEBB|nr:hypothetical protein [Propionicicella superfundia]